MIVQRLWNDWTGRWYTSNSGKTLWEHDAKRAKDVADYPANLTIKYFKVVEKGGGMKAWRIWDRKWNRWYKSRKGRSIWLTRAGVSCTITYAKRYGKDISDLEIFEFELVEVNQKGN